MTYEFFNNWHIGDCLFQAIYFNRVAPLYPNDTFVLYCNDIPQIIESVEHMPNVSLRPLAEKTASAINCWIGDGYYWHSSPLRGDHLAFYIHWFERISAKAGLTCPIRHKDEFWFDYPALHKTTPLSHHFDFLVVNAEPRSGQFRYSPGEMDELIAQLVKKGHSVVVTNPTTVPGVPCTLTHGISITGIGNVSNFCDRHIMISTGPSWPTFNVTNKNSVKLRLILLDSIKLDYGPSCQHFGYVQGARNYLATQNLI
jgi:hypothetical protein